MGQTCGCGKKNGDLLQDTDDNMPINENWNKAVIAGSVVGCKTIFNDDMEVIDQMVNFQTGWRAIHYAIKHRSVEMLEFLLENDADVDAQTRDTKNTALHEAAIANHVPLIKLLLTYGCDPDIKNGKGQVARDLCSKNLRREFNKSKIQALKRHKGTGKEGVRGTGKEKEEIFIHGKPISQQNLGAIRKINQNTDTQTEETKRHKAKLEEIQSRTEFLTDFGRIVGCEVDELGAFFEKLDDEGREELWNKIMKRNKTLEKPTDVKKLLLAITATVVRTKMLKDGKAVKHFKIEDNPIEYLVGVLRRKFPRDNRNKKVLTRSVFSKKLHLWFYEIHESIEWQETKM